MMRVLIASVIVIALGALAVTQYLGGNEPGSSGESNNSIEQAEENIRKAVNQELERAQELSQPGE